MAKLKKYWWVVAIVLFIIIGLMGGWDKAEPEQQNSNTSISASTGEQTIEPQKDLTTEQKIENEINDKLKGNNNRGQEYIRSIDIQKDDNGLLNVFVEFNADDNLTSKMIKGGIEGVMTDIYTILAQYEEVGSARISAYYTLTDRYGNKDDGLVYQTSLNKDIMSKINWEQPRSELKNTILPTNWDLLIMHPSLLD